MLLKICHAVSRPLPLSQTVPVPIPPSGKATFRRASPRYSGVRPRSKSPSNHSFGGGA